MGYNTAKTWVTGEALTASDLNAQLRDNILYLLNRPSAVAEGRNLADISITSTSMAAVDDNFYNLDITTVTGKAIVELTGGSFLVVATDTLYVDLLIDGTTYLSSNTGTPATKGSAGFNTSDNMIFPANLRFYVSGLTPNVSHNFKLRARAAVGGSNALQRLTTLTQFRVTETS